MVRFFPKMMTHHSSLDHDNHDWLTRQTVAKVELFLYWMSTEDPRPASPRFSAFGSGVWTLFDWSTGPNLRGGRVVCRHACVLFDLAQNLFPPPPKPVHVKSSQRSLPRRDEKNHELGGARLKAKGRSLVPRTPRR